MELRCNFGGTGCGCDVTWIKVRYEHQDLHWGEIRPGWINWGEHYLSKPGWELDGTWMKLIYRSSEIDGKETRPGRRWDASVGTRMELTCEPSDLDGGQVLHGWKWCKYVRIWIQMRQELNGVETYLETWVSLRWWLLESEMQFCRPEWSWDVHL